MRQCLLMIGTVLGLNCIASAESLPLHLSLQPEWETVYAPPEPPRDDAGVNEGGVNVFLTVRYLTDHVFRGIDRSETGGAEDSPNLQLDAMMKFDLGRLPHPFLGVFVNVYDSDPLSRFQEIRPYFGAEMNIRPILFTVGHTSYIYPEREEFNTAEVWARLMLDDSYFFRTERPILSPYILAAYDYDTYRGVYLELGISHEIIIENTGISLVPQASVAYVVGHAMFTPPTPPVADPGFSFGAVGDDTGFAFYQIGLVGRYRLNELLNIPRRYGEFDLEGYLYYTDRIDRDLRADRQLWGGVGIAFRY